MDRWIGGRSWIQAEWVAHFHTLPGKRVAPQLHQKPGHASSWSPAPLALGGVGNMPGSLGAVLHSQT